MKTIHRMIAAGALVLAPLAVHAQSAGTTTSGTTTTTTSGGDVGSTGSGTSTSDVGASGTGTNDVGTSGSGTNDVGTSGTGTNDVGAGGSGTNDVGAGGSGTNDVGAGGTGTTDVGTGGTGTSPTTMTSSQTTSTAYEPAVTLLAKSTSLRTPGSMPVTVVLSADANLSPAQARDIAVPLSSSSAACVVPASVVVSWNSTNGGSATVNVACSKATAQTVTITSGGAKTSFTIK